jgi:hypothetical protein
MKPKFKMLIGDDAFEDERTAEGMISGLLYSMANCQTPRAEYQTGRIENGIYRTDIFPSPSFSGAEIKTAYNLDSMVRESQGQWDWIVSDLDYGWDRWEEGMDIMAKIKNPDAVTAIFTSNNNITDLLRLEEQANVRYFIAPALIGDERRSKVDLLAETMVKHYS